MIERLPTPWGLVRLGVAPDHPKLKAVSRAFERIADQPGFRFFGNVEVGRDVHHEELVRLYDAVIYTVGAQTDRRLGIPGEDLPGSWAATEFVAWYNGHPDYQQLEFDLSAERAVVIGNGNVAIDVARMLALTHEELAPTDATDASIAAIESSAISEIVMLGRRGPAQAAFTPPELQEMGELAGADVVVDPADLELGARAQAALEARRRRAQPRCAARVRGPRAGRQAAARRLPLLVSPVAILGDERVEGIELVRNELDANERPSAPCRRTSTRRCRAGSSFAAWATSGVGLPGVAFDEKRGTIPNEGGRVAEASGRLRRRLDQARPERRDRHEQEGRDRDGRAPARGRRRRSPPAEAEATAERRHAACRARRALRRVRRLVGDRRSRAGGSARSPVGRA